MSSTVRPGRLFTEDVEPAFQAGNGGNRCDVVPETDKEDVELFAEELLVVTITLDAVGVRSELNERGIAVRDRAHAVVSVDVLAPDLAGVAVAGDADPELSVSVRHVANRTRSGQRGRSPG